ncbi:MAG: Clp protease N-terminal domain-containing protein [Candidatus Acidiferrales bacterium]
MFERFTEKARRAIFFARYEASQYGSQYIETEHLLLGILREDRGIVRRLLPADCSLDSIRSEIESHIEPRERISNSVEVPLTQECKRILNFAVEEADRLANEQIENDHLLLGILHEQNCAAALILTARGLNLPAAREALTGSATKSSQLRLGRPGGRGVEIGKALDAFLGAWNRRDAKECASAFEHEGRFWDSSATLLLGHAAIEKAISHHFSLFKASDPDADVRDVKFVRLNIATVTIVCGPASATQAAPSREFLMTLIMIYGPSAWLITNATLARFQPPPAAVNPAP